MGCRETLKVEGGRGKSMVQENGDEGTTTSD